MIDENEAKCNEWGSCEYTSELVYYLNTLNLTDNQFKKLEEIILKINRDCQGLLEQIFGEDT